jgi:hypothetical protein
MAGIEGGNAFEHGAHIEIAARPDDRLVALGRVMTFPEQDILDTEGRGAEEIALKGDAVAIPASSP